MIVLPMIVKLFFENTAYILYNKKQNGGNHLLEGKTYTKKVKKTAAVLKFSQKVGKLKKGSRVQVSVYSKFNKIRFGDTIKVK